MNDYLEYGDLVEHIPTRETWTVDQVIAATAYKPERVVLFRAKSDDGVIRASVLDCSPEQVQLVCKVTDRTIFPGCALSDDIRPALDELSHKLQEQADAQPSSEDKPSLPYEPGGSA